MVGAFVLLTATIFAPKPSAGQNTPLISGGVGFFSSTNGGRTSYLPVVSPLIAAPLGQHLLVESRAMLIESISPRGGGQSGYNTSAFLGLSFLQLDYLANSHATLVAGEFLTPFGTYNERLSPIWIGNFEEGPLIFGLGTMTTGSSVGGMLRGSAFSNAGASVDYSAYFSAKSTNPQFNSERSAGGKVEFYFPGQRLELGTSYGHLIESTGKNFIGAHVWWEPDDSHFKLRSEYAHGPHSQGFWVETDYRLANFGGEDSAIGRLEPVARWQQVFRSSPDSSDGLPSADAQRADFGLDYHFPHEVRINTSYSRQFSSTGNRNIWDTSITYRFMFPTWKGK
jgi:hypothetical protein